MRLLLALDDTADSARVADALSTWARDASPEIHVLSVLNPGAIHETSRGGVDHTSHVPPVTSTGVAIPVKEPPISLAEDRSQAFVRARAERTDRLRHIAQQSFPSSEVTVHVEDTVRVARAILDAAHRLDVDLVAMGARDRSSFSAAAFGSVHEEVVRHCRVPVLVVGPAVPKPL